MKKNSFIFILFVFLLMPVMVKASSYTTNYDLFDSSYVNNLVDMAQTQITDLNSKSYIVFRTNDDYYLISAKTKDVTVSGNTITLLNSTIIRCLRVQNGYNYSYQYSTINEASSTVYVNNIVVSNINTSKSIASKRYDEYLRSKNLQVLSMFILGLVFALFLTKERRY